MLLLGEFLPAARVAEMGLVNRVVPLADVENTSMEIARIIADKSPAAVKIGKQAFYEQLEMPLEEAYAFAGQTMADNMMARDARPVSRPSPARNPCRNGPANDVRGSGTRAQRGQPHRPVARVHSQTRGACAPRIARADPRAYPAELGEVAARCRRLASALAKRGIGKGDTVALIAPNIPEALECALALPLLGAVLNANNTRLDAGTIAYVLEHGEAKVLLVDTEYSAMAAEAVAQSGRDLLIVDIEDSEGPGGDRIGALTYDDLLAEGDPDFRLYPAG